MLSGMRVASSSPVPACVLMRLGPVSREHLPARGLFGSIRVSAFNSLIADLRYAAPVSISDQGLLSMRSSSGHFLVTREYLYLYK